MHQRLSLITLGVVDLTLARAFYRQIGWQEAAISTPEIAFFQCPGLGLALWPIDRLEQATGVKGGAPGAVTLACNLASRAEIDGVLWEWERAGGTVLKPPHDVPWGTLAYAADPDAHIWEIAYVPSLVPDPETGLTLR